MDGDRVEKFPEVHRVGRGGPGGHHSDRGEEPHQVPDRRGRVGGQEGIHRVDEGGGAEDEGESEQQQGGPAGQLARPPRRPRPRHLRPEQVLQTAQHSRLTSQVDKAESVRKWHTLNLLNDHVWIMIKNECFCVKRVHCHIVP